jgi:hypothetical protein
MAKLVVQHDEDPAIAIVLETVPEGTPGRAHGTYGTCTQCGWPMHRWSEEHAVLAAERHVDSHEALVSGIDPSSVVRG